jgi:hypothetical protein
MRATLAGLLLAAAVSAVASGVRAQSTAAVPPPAATAAHAKTVQDYASAVITIGREPAG